MKNILTITRRELGTYFASPLFYVIATVFLIIQSFISFQALDEFSYQSYQEERIRQMGLTLNINEWVVEPSLIVMSQILLFITPMVTMRSFAEERRQKTFTLLLASPVHLWEIVLGKFFACLAVLSGMVLISSYYIGFILAVGTPEIGPIVTGYLGVLLIAACYAAIGVFASSLTENQIIAAVLTFGIILMFWLIGLASQSVGTTMGDVLEYLALFSHMQNFTRGIIDTSDLMYYVSFTGFALFLTYRVLESRRWR